MSYAEERPFRPTLLGDSDFTRLTDCIVLTRGLETLERCRSLRNLVDAAVAAFETDTHTEHLRLAVAASVLADLSEQEWDVDLRDGEIKICPPNWTHASGHDVARIKSRVRNSLQLASDRQIATDAVQDFIRSMERPRVFEGRIVSIAALIDDGSALYARMRALHSLDSNNRCEELARLFKPYIQICDDDSTCEFTGLSLLDVWRYFRHTWSLEYNPLPGRTLRLLVRNRARPNHPVIGIAMLASPAANLYQRDDWIGWRLDDVTKGLLENSLDANKVAKALWTTVKEAIADIRSDDLLSAAEQESPTDETFFKLRQIAGLAQRRRRSDLTEATGQDRIDDNKIVDIRTFRKRQLGHRDWARLSETPLFVRKRAEQLIPLLRAYAYLKQKGLPQAPAAALYETLISKHGRSVVAFVLGELRKRKLATEVADLAVCGAVPPYNELLGGKLITLLMASEDVRRIYSQRYGSQESEIASQMAGRPIVRPSNLMVLTTTSLYGISSSQYNRLNLTVEYRNKLRAINWKCLGSTKGVTVTHLSRRTVNLMRKLGTNVYGARRINSVFGEGSSPRTRQIREGLNLIGINNDHALEQSIGRLVYGCELFPDARNDLTGFCALPKLRTAPPAAALSKAWIKRWLSRRVLNIDVLERVRSLDSNVISKGFRDRALRGRIELSNEPGELNLGSPMSSLAQT